MCIFLRLLGPIFSLKRRYNSFVRVCVDSLGVKSNLLPEKVVIFVQKRWHHYQKIVLMTLYLHVKLKRRGVSFMNHPVLCTERMVAFEGNLMIQVGVGCTRSVFRNCSKFSCTRFKLIPGICGPLKITFSKVSSLFEDLPGKTVSFH